MAQRAPFTTTLQERPLSELLAGVLTRRVTGAMVFESPDGVRYAIIVERGRVQKCWADAPVSTLSDLLLEFGWLGEKDVAETYEVALLRRQPFGRTLVDLNFVTPRALDKILVTQLVRKLRFIGNLPRETHVSFYEGLDPLPTIPALPMIVTPLSTLWNVATCHAEAVQQLHFLEQFRGRPLHLHPLSDLAQFGFNSRELAFVANAKLLQADWLALCSEIGLTRPIAQSLIYVLLLTRHIEQGQQLRPIGVDLAEPAHATIATQQPESVTAEAPGVDESETTSLDRATRRALAADAHQRAERLLRQGRLPQALEQAKAATDLDPEEHVYLGLRVWIESSIPGNSEQLAVAIATLDAVVEREPMNLTMRYYRAQILKRLDRMAEAVAEWRLIAEFDGNHIDAVRELRLWEMRSSRPPPKRSLSGIQRVEGPVARTPSFFGRLLRRR